MFDDLANWRQMLEEGHVRWTAGDAERRLADALASKFDSKLRHRNSTQSSEISRGASTASLQWLESLGASSDAPQVEPTTNTVSWLRRLTRQRRI